jgi:tetratricopeptide (TPR) repeat protein
VALAEARAPGWVCALGRPTFEQTRPSWGDRAGRREVHRLGPLDATSAAALCRRLLLPVANVPDSAVMRLIERTQAVPLLLVELVRGLKREGIVRRNPKGDSWYLATDELDRLPDLPLIEWLARREVDALAPALASHARLIALLGAGVTIPEVDGVLRRLDRQGNAGEFPLDARVGVHRLLAAGVLVQGQQGHIGFRHELIRDSVAQSIPAPLRRQIHLAAADHYREGSSVLEARRLSQLAFHAARAGLGRIAENAYLTLAEQARARHAYLEAERLYSRALELSVGAGGARGSAQSTGSPSAMSDAERAAYRGRGLMRYRLGRYHDALADLARAHEAANERGDRAAEVALLLDQATVLDWMDEFTTSRERVRQAEELFPEGGSEALHTGLLLGIGRSLHRHSCEREAAGYLERAVLLAEPLGDEGYETLVIALLMLGFILQGLGRLDEAGRALDRVIALCEEHGDTLHLVPAVSNRALLRALLGNKAEMIAGLTRVLSLARELGQATLELVGHYNLGEYLYLMDDLEAAGPHVDRAVAIEQQRMGDDARPVVALLAARLRLYRGEEEHALAILDSIRSRQTWAHAADQPNTLMVPSEGVFCKMIDLATRGADDVEWDELEAESERFSIGQEYIEVLEMRAISALRRGLHEQASRQLERALAAADRIPNVMRARLERQLAAARAR